MEADKNIPSYHTGCERHFGLCSTYRVQSKHFDKRICAEHPGWEICFASQLSQQMEIRKQKFQIDPQTILIYNAREAHTEIYKQDQPADFQVLLIEPEFINEMLHELNFRDDNVIFDHVDYPAASDFFLSLKSIFELRQAEELDSLALEANLIHLFLELVERFPSSLSTTLLLSKNRSYFPQKVKAIKREIWNSFTSPQMDLNFLSGRCGVSKFYMARLFKNVTGISIGNYITSLRLTEAKKRLKLSRHRITDICAEVGYSDLSAFNKAFKKSEGVSPRIFRNSASATQQDFLSF